MKNELWKKRALIWNFALSDLKLRYRNSVLGFFWTVLEPLLMLAVLYFVFTSLFPSPIEQFGLYLLLGIIMWNMFARGTELGLNSFLARSGMLGQIYFPREVMAISSALTAFLMLIFELLVFGIFLIVFQFIPPITILLLPLVLILEFILTVGLNFSLSVLNVRFRDTQFIWRVILQAGFFLTPIIYSFQMLPEYIQNVLKISPMAQLVNIGHDLALYNKMPNEESILISILVVGTIFIVSYLVYKKYQKRIIEEL